MAINFPATAGQPTDGSFTHSEAGVAYFWDGDSWVANAGNVTPQTDLTALSVTTNAAGSAALSYDNTTGVFSYTPPDLSGYLTSETSHTDVVVDGDFTSNGLMKRTAAGSYGIVTDNSSDWDVAYGWGDHSTAGYLTSYTVTASDLGTISIDALSDVDTTTATTGRVLKWDGTVWTPAEDIGSGYLYTRNPSIYEIIGLESWTSIHNAPILFTQALDDPTGAGNQPTWLQSYYNEVSGDSNNATATLTTVATGGHAAMNQQTADGVTLQTAIRNFVNSTGSLPNGVGWAFYNITPTGLGSIGGSSNKGPETYTVDGVSYPVMGRLYVPDYSAVGARDVIVAFHGTLPDDDPDPAVVATQDGIQEQAADFLNNVLINANTLSLVDKIVFSVACPQDHISNVRQYNLSGVGKEEPTFLMGDNLSYARAAVKWVINSLDTFIADNGGSATIGDVYLLGHSQGGKLAAKINTLETGIAGVVSNSPGPIQFDLTCSADPTNDTCSKVAYIHGPSNPSSSGGSGLQNITDSAQGVNVTGRVACTGVDISTGGQFNAAGCSIDFQSATISFSGASISGLSGEIRDNVDLHLNQTDGTNVLPNNGEVLSWNSTGGGAGTGDYEWIALSSSSGLTSVQQDTNPTLGANLALNGFDITGTGNIGITGTVSDSHGNLRETEILNQTSDYTLTTSDSGKTIAFANSNGTVTIPTGLNTGSIVTIINHTGTDITITEGTGLTLYNTADGLTGGKTASQRSISTIVYIATNIAYISGTGLS